MSATSSPGRYEGHPINSSRDAVANIKRLSILIACFCASWFGAHEVEPVPKSASNDATGAVGAEAAPIQSQTALEKEQEIKDKIAELLAAMEALRSEQDKMSNPATAAVDEAATNAVPQLREPEVGSGQSSESGSDGTGTNQLAGRSSGSGSGSGAGSMPSGQTDPMSRSSTGSGTTGNTVTSGDPTALTNTRSKIEADSIARSLGAMDELRAEQETTSNLSANAGKPTATNAVSQLQDTEVGSGQSSESGTGGTGTNQFAGRSSGTGSGSGARSTPSGQTDPMSRSSAGAGRTGNAVTSGDPTALTNTRSKIEADSIARSLGAMDELLGDQSASAVKSALENASSAGPHTGGNRIPSANPPVSTNTQSSVNAGSIARSLGAMTQLLGNQPTGIAGSGIGAASGAAAAVMTNVAKPIFQAGQTPRAGHLVRPGGSRSGSNIQNQRPSNVPASGSGTGNASAEPGGASAPTATSATSKPSQSLQPGNGSSRGGNGFQSVDSAALAKNRSKVEADSIARSLQGMDELLDQQGGRVATELAALEESNVAAANSGSQAGQTNQADGTPPTGTQPTPSAVSQSVAGAPVSFPNKQSRVRKLAQQLRNAMDSMEGSDDEELVMDDYAKTLYEAYEAETDPVMKQALLESLDDYLNNKKR